MDVSNVQTAPFSAINICTLTSAVSTSSDKTPGTIDAMGEEFIFTGLTFEGQTAGITGQVPAKEINTFVPSDSGV